MTDTTAVFRTLQVHLDGLAVGFPVSSTGADLRLLQQLFSAKEAEVALHLTNEASSLREVAARAGERFTEAELGTLLDGMTMRGAIGRREAGGEPRWYLEPFIVGMFETSQDGVPRPEFAGTTMEYVLTGGFAAAFQSAQPPIMRVVPVNQSIPVEHHVTTHNDLRAVIAASPGPFAVLPCICRELNTGGGGGPCKVTTRRETCMVLGDAAAGALRRGHGREISPEELLELVDQSERDGLVLQPSNAQQPEAVCACCSCCCGLLAFQRLVPRPAREWNVAYQMQVDDQACSLCAECESRCQLDAIAVPAGASAAQVDPDRCLGCGQCATVCPTGALHLVPNPDAVTPPPDVPELLRSNAASRARAH